MTPEEILLKAADLVESGWTQGAYCTYNAGVPRYCVVGALIAASETGAELLWSPLYSAAETALNEYIKEQWPKYNGFSVTRWNDDPERSQDEVASTLRKVAASV